MVKIVVKVIVSILLAVIAIILVPHLRRYVFNRKKLGEIKAFIGKKYSQHKFRTMTVMIYNTLKKNEQPENAIINYILQQAKAGEIQLAKKDQKVYISFVNENISTFLNDWLMISNNQKEGMSNGAYNDFFKTMLNRYKMDVSFIFKNGKITAEKDIETQTSRNTANIPEE